ncbi:MAG: YdbC family protein [Ruminococcus sp.]|nr:YdbC family protein [Ruminococcus sp.]
MAELKYEITEKVGVLGENAKGWTKELNLISWNDHEPKYDIRDWSPDHSRMGKGVTLTADELASLKDILAEIDLDSFDEE